MSLSDRGKWAEKEVQFCLNDWSAADSRFAFHRFPDARAARGALPAQPSDYLVVMRLGRKRTILLEVKETEEVRRLPKKKIGQFGKLQMFFWAGAEIRVVVYRSKLQDWTYFDEDDLFCYPECPPSFPFVEGRSFPTAIDTLNHLFT
jgi:hypothetical protein